MEHRTDPGNAAAAMTGQRRCTVGILIFDDIITSAGISAGIDMSLHVVARLHGQETARWTARRMEYDGGV